MPKDFTAKTYNQILPSLSPVNDKTRDTTFLSDENADSALILTAHIDGLSHLPQNLASFFSFIIAADRGYACAASLGLTPDIVIGDFDSAPAPDLPFIRLPREKDETDTEAACALAFARGYRRITICGGLGGRLDHTMGNLGILRKGLEEGASLSLLDGGNYVRMLPSGSYAVSMAPFGMNLPYLGLISFERKTVGITLENVKYPLNDFTLYNDTSRGVSNEIISSPARLSFKEGILLVIHSTDR